MGDWEQGRLVSVVVPTRDRAPMLARSLAALAAQTHSPLEVIVVDDGSTDDTPAVIERSRSAHPTLAFISLRNDPPRGANPSRNRGIALARGEFVAFEDDDCIADPRWVEQLVAAFTSARVGAVTGTVIDAAPRNIYDLALAGTHLVSGDRHANRVVACNMCVRRALLPGKLDEDRAQVSADMSVSGRGDEEDLYLKLKAEGFEVLIARDARTLHIHHHTRSSFYRQAKAGGGSAARLGYKYRLAPRLELLCLASGYLFGLGAVLVPLMLVPSAACFGLFAGATLVYNEIWRKGKSWGQAWRIAPVMIGYYHARTYGYFRQLARLALGVDRLERVRLPGVLHRESLFRPPGRARGGMRVGNPSSISPASRRVCALPGFGPIR